MLTTDLNNLPHPDELLGAYALDTLDQRESLRVESHLEACFQCRESVAGLRQVSAALGRSVGHRAPPVVLQRRVMNALPQQESRSPARARPARRWTRALVPLAATLVTGLVVANLVMNIVLASRVNSLHKENSMLSRLEKLAAEESQFMDSLHQLRVASYWLADSAIPPMILEPPGKTGKSQGILLMTKDGRRAILMVAGMRELPPPSSYEVWMVRQDQRVWVGQLKVDSKGWGTVNLYPPETLFGFEKVALTSGGPAAGERGPEDMVLEGQIIAKHLAK